MKPFVVVLVIVAIGPCSSPATPPATAPVPKEATPKDIYELRERCAKDAREWFKQNYSAPQDSIPVQGGGDISSLPPTYENHYSQTHNGCFAVLSQMTSFKFSAQPNPKDQIIQSNTLWDVNENSQLGAFVMTNLNEIAACNVLGTKCASKGQWMKLAASYIAE